MAMVGKVIKALVDVFGAKNVIKAGVKVGTAKPVREVAKKIIKSEIKKKLK